MSSCELVISRVERIAAYPPGEKVMRTGWSAVDVVFGAPSPLEPETSYANSHRMIGEKGSSDRVDFEFTKPGVYLISFPRFADDIPLIVEVE